MKFNFLTKVTPHKKFHFTPRFYDEQKEHVEKLIEKNKLQTNEEELTNDERKIKFQQEISKKWNKKTQRKKVKLQNNLRIIIVILLLLILIFYIFKYPQRVKQNKSVQKIEINK
ncbi:MAG: hypothetical protein HYU67_09270 [Flavobacteriia bacterium]|nr:hypothetical protein [Flavobacteriia bacterium]